MLIDGLKIAEKINLQTKKAVAKLIKRGITPKIAVILVGDLAESKVYIRQKRKLAEKLGFVFAEHIFPNSIKEDELMDKISLIQAEKSVVGVIVQIPLPKKFHTTRVLAVLDPSKDIDCLSEKNLGRLMQRETLVLPPTVDAIWEIIKNQKINLAGKNVVVIGAGLLVGRPLVLLLMEQRATVTVCNRATKNLAKLCREAEVIITAAGQRNLITKNMARKNTLVIDAGFSFYQGKSYGDVDAVALDKLGACVTPTPGGVGPITVACLMRNAAKLAKLI